MKIKTLLSLIVVLFIITLNVVFTPLIVNATTAKAQSRFNEYLEYFSNEQIFNLEQCFEGFNAVIDNILENDTLLNSLANRDFDESAQSLADAYVSDSMGIVGLAVVDTGDVGSSLHDIMLFAGLNFEGAFIAAESLNERLFYCIKENDETHYILTKRELASDIYLVALFSALDLDGFVAASAFRGNGRTILIDPHGVVLDLELVENIENLDRPEYNELKARMTDDNYVLDDEWVYFSVGNKERMAFINAAGDSGWYTVALSDVELAFDFSRAAVENTKILSRVIALAFSAIAVFAVQLFFKPLDTVEKVVQSLKRGNRGARIDIPSKNEYGELAATINALSDKAALSEARYKAAVEMSNNIIFEWNLSTQKVKFCNNLNKKFSFKAVSDYYSDSFLANCNVHPDDAARYAADFEGIAKGEPLERAEYRIQNVFGDYVWLLMKTACVFADEDKIIVGVLADIEHIKKDEPLNMNVGFDALTETFNRETLETIINRELGRLSENKNRLALLFVNIVALKQYNDEFSRAVGDRTLKFVAATIEEMIYGFGVIGRFSGDDFVACIRNSDINSPDKIARDLIEKLKIGFTCDEAGRLTINVCIGIVTASNHSKKAIELINTAEKAMLKVKENEKSGYGFGV